MAKAGATRRTGAKSRVPGLGVLSVSWLLLMPLACGDNGKANTGKGGAGGGLAGAGGRGGSGGSGGAAARGGSGGSGGAVGAGGNAGRGGSGGAGGKGGTSGGSGGAGGGGNGGSAGRGGGGGGGTGGSAGTGASGGTAGSAGGAGGGTAGTAGGSGGAGGGTAGAGGGTGGAGTGGTAGGTGGTAGGTGGTGGGNACTLPPTDAGTPATLPDNVVYLANVTVSTLAGTGTPGTTNGAFGVGLLANPVSVAIEPSGTTLAVSDFDNDRLRRVLASDGTLSTLTMQTGFQRPFGLAVAGGFLYAATDSNPSGQRSMTSGTIWRIDGASGVATAVGINLGRPRGLAALSDGRLALADYQNQRIRVFDPTTGSVADVAGMQGCPGSANGTGTDARFVTPIGIAVVTGDRIIVADYDAHILREVSLAGVVTTFAGDGVAGTIDGPRASARFVGPRALAADASGAVYVSDPLANRVRRIAADGTVTTVAGDGTGGFNDGPGNMAEFFGQEGIAVSADGATIYVADGTLGGEPPGPYNRIRKIVIAP